MSWFKAPQGEDEIIVCGSDESAFPLDDLSKIPIRDVIAERGCDYYNENRVRYISLDGTQGYTIVEGTEAYEVEFRYSDGNIQNLVCSCYCSYNCKHEYAAMLQLKETLRWIGSHHADTFRRTDYFAAVHTATLLSLVADGKKAGSITF